MYRILIASTLFWFIALASCDARATTALEMASSCKPIEEATVLEGGQVYFEDSGRANRCWGAFVAVQQAITTTYTDSAFPAHYVCAPEDSTLIQLVKIFRRYVAEHPERGHERFFNVAVEALRTVYPCR